MLSPSVFLTQPSRKTPAGGISFKVATLKFFPEKVVGTIYRNPVSFTLCGVQSKSAMPMSHLASIGGGRLHARGQLLPRFLKAPLIARRVHNICCGTAA